MALSKTNTAVVLLVGFVNYLEWAVVMTSIYPYILSASILIILYISCGYTCLLPKVTLWVIALGWDRFGFPVRFSPPVTLQ